jgi:chaperonin GroES
MEGNDEDYTKTDYVVVKVDAMKDDTTKSGIVVVKNKTNDDRQQTGTILAVGEGRLLENGTFMPIGLKVDQKVLFNKYAGTEIKVEGSSDVFMLIHERDILAKVE